VSEALGAPDGSCDRDAAGRRQGTERSISIHLPIRTVSEPNQREHWSKKARRVKDQRCTTGLVVRAELRRSKLSLDDGLVVTLCRVAPRTLDDDNLRGATKGLRDGVADALGINDRDPRVSWEYEQRRGHAGEYAVSVTISDRTDVARPERM
jgi:hypothetical protein